MICAIDIETTGLHPGVHEIVDIALIPLTESFYPAGPMFTARIRAGSPQNADPAALAKHRLDINDGESRDHALSGLIDFYLTLDCDKIETVGHFLQFDIGFITYFTDGAVKFSGHRRDTMTAALMLQDAGIEEFSGFSLDEIAKTLGIVNDRPHSAFHDALTAARCWRAMKARIGNGNHKHIYHAPEEGNG